MSNPTNNFDNFFTDPSSAAHKFRPNPEQVVEALMIITSQNHGWYKEPELRLMVLMTLSKLAQELQAEEKIKGKIDMPVHAAAFLMVLGDFVSATRQYASDIEIKQFPTGYEDEENED